MVLRRRQVPRVSGQVVGVAGGAFRQVACGGHAALEALARRGPLHRVRTVGSIVDAGRWRLAIHARRHRARHRLVPLLHLYARGAGAGGLQPVLSAPQRLGPHHGVVGGLVTDHVAAVRHARHGPRRQRQALRRLRHGLGCLGTLPRDLIPRDRAGQALGAGHLLCRLLLAVQHLLAVCGACDKGLPLGQL